MYFVDLVAVVAAAYFVESPDLVAEHFVLHPAVIADLEVDFAAAFVEHSSG